MNKKTLVGAMALAAASSAFAGSGAIFTSTNQTSGNAVIAFKRAANGHLTQAETYSTGGLGTGGGLGNQGAVTLSGDGKYLYVVNAGSNTLSTFRVKHDELTLIDVVVTEGVRPISVTQRGNLVYVLNAGDAQNPGNIRGFWQGRGGGLDALPGAGANLSAPSVGPAQIQFDPSSRNLVVTEKATNLIDVFELGFLGQVTSASYNPSNGQTPFGFDIDHRGRLMVSEAFGGTPNASAVSSYRLRRDTDLIGISPSVGTTETAACWVSVTPNGKFAFTTNAGSSSVSGYQIAADGTITLLNADGVTGATGMGSSPNDLDTSRDGRYLYVKTNGTNSIVSFQIQANGQLVMIDQDGGLPTGANGLAAS